MDKEFFRKIEDTPHRNLKQILAVVLYVNGFMALPFISIIFSLFVLCYFNYIGRIICASYLVLIYIDHLKHFSPLNANGWLWFRNMSIGNYVRDYFSIELIKTAELKPNRNYLIISCPHGITCIGILTNMANNIGNWLKLYPGVRPKIATLDYSFYMPLFGDLFRLWGFISCSKKSLTYFLSKSNDPKDSSNKDGFTSNAVCLVVGGVREALDSCPGRYILTLKNRQGYAKIAINTGSPIVPSFTFGEVDIFDRTESCLEPLLNKYHIKNHFVFGSRFLKYALGFFPNRKRIVQVVGAPIEVEKLSNPSAKYIDDIHQKVIDSLNEIFEKYKHKYLENANEIELVIN